MPWRPTSSFTATADPLTVSSAEGTKSVAGAACESVQLALPAWRYSTGRSGDRLIQRVVMRWRENRTIQVLLGLVVPEPVLARFVALHDGMSRAVRMTAGVLRRRGVAAPYMAAMGTPPEVEPPPTRFLTLDAARAARWCA